MKKQLHIMLLEEPQKAGTPEDQLTVYISRYSSQNEAYLMMHQQGILPQFRVVSHSTMPVWKTLLIALNPSWEVIAKHYGKLTLWTWLKYKCLPIKKIFKGSVRKNYQQLGEYDTTTLRVYPLPEEKE